MTTKRTIYIGEPIDGIPPMIMLDTENVIVIDRPGEFEKTVALFAKLKESGELDIFEERERLRKEKSEAEN